MLAKRLAQGMQLHRLHHVVTLPATKLADKVLVLAMQERQCKKNKARAQMHT